MKTYFRNFLLLFLLASQQVFAQQSNSVYRSETLQIEQLSPHTFVHISYLQTDDFGKVGCNGMVVINGGEAMVFDTPADEAASLELINWLEKERGLRLKGAVATHFHMDCVGGLEEFHVRKIPSYGSTKTIELTKTAGSPIPQNGFEEQLALEVGDISVVTQYFGEGHTSDNVVSYVPEDRVLFGGCMIKEMNAGVGFIGDANVSAWPTSVEQMKSTFSDIQIVIPGHGKIGGQALLDYTIQLFSGNKTADR